MTLFLGHHDITILFYCLFAAAFINAGFYLFGQLRLERYIRKNREELYEKLGRPVTGIRRYYSLEEIKASLLKTKYILYGDFSEIPDEKLRRLAKQLRFSAFFHIVAVCLIMCTIPLMHSSKVNYGSPGTERAGMVAAAYDSYKQGRYTEALNLLNQVLEKYPDDFSGYYYRAFVLEKTGRYDDALDDFIRCAEIKQDSFDVFLHIDWILSRRQQWNDVIRYWDMYISHNPGNARAYLERGGAYWHMHDIENAMHDAEKACELGNREGCLRYRQAKKRIETL